MSDSEWHPKGGHGRDRARRVDVPPAAREAEQILGEQEGRDAFRAIVQPAEGTDRAGHDVVHPARLAAALIENRPGGDVHQRRDPAEMFAIALAQM